MSFTQRGSTMFKKFQLIDENLPHQESSFCKLRLPKTISRNNDRNFPLPSPFPLPENYRADVAAALEADQISADFFLSILSAVFKYKKTLVTEDYCGYIFKATSGKSCISTSYNYKSFVIPYKTKYWRE